MIEKVSFVVSFLLSLPLGIMAAKWLYPHYHKFFSRYQMYRKSEYRFKYDRIVVCVQLVVGIPLVIAFFISQFLASHF